MLAFEKAAQRRLSRTGGQQCGQISRPAQPAVVRAEIELQSAQHAGPGPEPRPEPSAPAGPGSQRRPRRRRHGHPQDRHRPYRSTARSPTTRRRGRKSPCCNRSSPTCPTGSSRTIPTSSRSTSRSSARRICIGTLRAQSQEALKTHRAALGVQIKNLENQIEDQKQKAALALSGPLAEFNQLKTKSDRTKAEYDRLLSNYHSRRREQERRAGSAHRSRARLAGRFGQARAGARSSSPALGGGLFVGLIILFIIDQIDDRISSLMELQTHFPEQLLGQIPQEKLPAGRRPAQGRRRPAGPDRIVPHPALLHHLPAGRGQAAQDHRRSPARCPTRARPPWPPISPLPSPSPAPRPSSSTPTCAAARSAISSARPNATAFPTSC